MSSISRPEPSEYAPHFEKYVATVSNTGIIGQLESQQAMLASYPRRVPADRETYRYADGKWTVRDVFGHLSDAERVFGYRLLCISRDSRSSLPGFDENRFVETAGFNRRSLQSLVDELVMVRESNLIVMRALDDDAWQNIGTSNNAPISVRALAYIMAGHINHHVALLRDRYGIHD